MANTYVYKNGTGNVATTFPFTFPYLKESDVKVAVLESGIWNVKTQDTHYEFHNATTLKFKSGQVPVSGTNNIKLYRSTSADKLTATFYPGSAIRSADLNDNFTQNLYSTEESKEASEAAFQSDGSTTMKSNIVFEGSSDDAHETTLTVTNPTADRTVTLPDQSGTVPVLAVHSDVAITSTPAELNLLDGVTSTTAELNILDGVTSSTAELNILDGVTANKDELNILDGVTADKDELNKLDGATASTAELNHVTGVTSAIQTQLNAKQDLDAELTELATMTSGTAGALADLTQAEVEVLDGATLSTAELNILGGVTASTAEINKLDGFTGDKDDLNYAKDLKDTGVTTTEFDYLDGVTSNVQTQLDAKQASSERLTQLAGMQSGTASILASGTALTSTTTELNLLDGKSVVTSVSGSSTDVQLPTAKAVNDQIVAVINDVGGFTPIADDQSFPNTNPDPGDDAGTIVSIADAGGLVVGDGNGGTVAGRSTTGRTLGGSTVTINGIDSSLHGTTIAAGKGMLVQTTSTLNTYDYHRLVVDEAGVDNAQTLVTDFNQRYRVNAGEPSSHLTDGDLVFDTSANKMKVYDSSASAWKEVTSAGDFKYLFLCPAGGTGAPTLNGSIATYDLREGSNSGSAASITNAAQLMVSINGVVQKANTGTSAPAEGFALVDSNTIIFGANLASGDSVFIIQFGSALTINEPGDDTVATAKIQNGAVTTAKIADDAVTGAKIADDAINSEHYTDGSIDTAHIADLNVTTAKIADDAVTVDKIGDADLVSLAGCQTGAAAALAALTSTEVEILDGATVSTAELNTLKDFTGDKDDLNYAKDLKATGVTDTEFDYLDGVTSAIQTQLDAKAPSANPSFTGLLTEEAKVTAGKLSDNTNIDLEDGMVHLFTTAESTTSTPNLRWNSSTALNTKVDTGESISVTIITTANASAFSAQLTIDGSTVTENWVGGSAPSAGGSSGVDIHAYTIIKTGSAQWTVIANHSTTS